MRADLGNGKLFGVADDSLVAYSQLVAAFGAAARQYGPPILTLHACTKPVCLCPLTIVRLKCSFWHYPCSIRASEPVRATQLCAKSGLIPKYQYKGAE
jgi:hypothetical protein